MAQILGALAVVAFLLSFQFKTRRNIIVVNILSRALYIFQYILLGALTGAILDFVGLVLSFFARYKEKAFIKKYFLLIVIAADLLLLTIGLFTYESIFTLFAIWGVLCEITALWLTKEKNIRILSLIAAPGWLIYNLASQAYGSAAGNVLTIASIVIAMLRLDFYHNSEDK